MQFFWTYATALLVLTLAFTRSVIISGFCVKVPIVIPTNVILRYLVKNIELISSYPTYFKIRMVLIRDHASTKPAQSLQRFRGRRQEVEGWGDASLLWKVCISTVHTKMGGLRFRIFPPWDPFSKKCISGAAFSGSVWTVGQNDAIHVPFCKRVFSTGWLLSVILSDN